MRRPLWALALALTALSSCTVTTDLPEPCPEACESRPGAEATCADGQCVIQCEAGRGDCDDDQANGCEVDLTADSSHCGSCERDCQIATCEDSRCIPTVVFEEQVAPSRVVVDGEHVYWINRGLGSGTGTIQFPFGSVHRTSRSNQAPVETLAENQNLVFDLAVDGTHLYWTAANEGLVRRWPLDGSAGPAVFVDNRQLPTGVGVDDTHVYLSEPAVGRLGRAEKATGSLQSLAVGQAFALYLAVHGGFMYWANNEGNAVQRIAVDGSSEVETVASGLSAPFELAVTDDYVFVTNSVIERNVPGTLVRIALDGGELVNVTSGTTLVGGVAVVGDWVYYGEGSPLFSLKRRPVDLSQEAETLITGLNIIADIAGDDSGIYFLGLDRIFFYPP